MALQLDIVTPEKKIFSDTVDTVVIPGVSGEAGLLPNHAPLVTTLAPGELRYVKNGKEEFLAIGEGFVEISDDNVSVITDLAVADADIDEKAVEEALKRAEEALKSKEDGGLSPEAINAMQVNIQKSLAQLGVKRRRRGH
jgi:F-type H+-transporting ATPase subunit epsilon